MWDMAKHSAQSGEVYREFQSNLKNVKMWNQNIVQREHKRIVERSKCEWADDLIKQVFKLNTQYLASVDSRTALMRIKVSVPDTPTFIHECYVNVARTFWVNVPLLEDRPHRITKIAELANYDRALVLIKEAIQTTIMENVPMKDLAQESLQAYSESEHDDSASDDYAFSGRASPTSSHHSNHFDDDEHENHDAFPSRSSSAHSDRLDHHDGFSSGHVNNVPARSSSNHSIHSNKSEPHGPVRSSSIHSNKSEPHGDIPVRSSSLHSNRTPSSTPIRPPPPPSTPVRSPRSPLSTPSGRHRDSSISEDTAPPQTWSSGKKFNILSEFDSAGDKEPKERAKVSPSPSRESKDRAKVPPSPSRVSKRQSPPEGPPAHLFDDLSDDAENSPSVKPDLETVDEMDKRRRSPSPSPKKRRDDEMVFFSDAE